MDKPSSNVQAAPRPTVIGVDFDGTVVTHRYPDIGADVGAIKWLKRFVRLGAKIVLFTMRDGAELRAAVKFLESNGIELYGINRNPTQDRWTMSPKAYAHVYIDDAAFGCPTIKLPGKRPYVNWEKVGPAMARLIQERSCVEEIHAIDVVVRMLKEDDA